MARRLVLARDGVGAACGRAHRPHPHPHRRRRAIAPGHRGGDARDAHPRCLRDDRVRGTERRDPRRPLLRRHGHHRCRRPHGRSPARAGVPRRLHSRARAVADRPAADRARTGGRADVPERVSRRRARGTFGPDAADSGGGLQHQGREPRPRRSPVPAAGAGDFRDAGAARRRTREVSSSAPTSWPTAGTRARSATSPRAARRPAAGTSSSCLRATT